MRGCLLAFFLLLMASATAHASQPIASIHYPPSDCSGGTSVLNAEGWAELSVEAGTYPKMLSEHALTSADNGSELPMAGEIALSSPRVNDQEAYSYGDNQPKNRFRADSTVTVRSTKVEAAIKAMQRAGELVSNGVLLTFDYGPEGSASFEYTALNDIKPALIAEATSNARQAAEQFAEDSGAKVGGIRHASQGQIDISDRDQSSPQVKKVRVVTTVEYFLVD